MRLDHLLSKEKVPKRRKRLGVDFLEQNHDKKGFSGLLFNFLCPFHKLPGHGGVAQLGEHLPCKQGVKGSIPFISTTMGSEGTLTEKAVRVHYRGGKAVSGFTSTRTQKTAAELKRFNSLHTNGQSG